MEGVPNTNTCPPHFFHYHTKWHSSSAVFNRTMVLPQLYMVGPIFLSSSAILDSHSDPPSPSFINLCNQAKWNGLSATMSSHVCLVSQGFVFLYSNKDTPPILMLGPPWYHNNKKVRMLPPHTQKGVWEIVLKFRKWIRHDSVEPTWLNWNSEDPNSKPKEHGWNLNVLGRTTSQYSVQNWLEVTDYILRQTEEGVFSSFKNNSD